MYQALYRKYRPLCFEDVCGQEHITSVLKMQLQTGRVSHAYMFCGSRGTGKTTCAKILAKAVNCENPKDGDPCNQCPSCCAIQEERVLDVVEMDAASHNGVDHIRALCDEVEFLPSEAKKRVYIIDEVHMLSNSAFNALLKTLEEPPAHVLFILATTETNSIPATILSRCQRFDFKRITPQVISQRLMKIAQAEQIPLEQGAADLLSRLSDGAMRDALSLLEACQGHQGVLSAEKIQEILGLGSRKSILSLCQAIVNQDTSSCLDSIAKIYEKTSDFKETVGELIRVFRDLLVIRSVPGYEKYLIADDLEHSTLLKIAENVTAETLTFQIRALEDFYVSYDRIVSDKKASAEILMIRLCNENLSKDPGALLSRISKLEKAIAGGILPLKKNEKMTPDPLNDMSRETSSEPGPAPEEIDQANTSNGERKFFAVAKLKNLLQQEKFFKPWLSMIDFIKKDKVLILQTGAFAKGVLSTADGKNLILKYAKEVDPEIEEIAFQEKKQENTPTASQFEGL